MTEFYINLSVDDNGMLERQCQRYECSKFFKINVEDHDGSQNKDLFCPHCGVEKYGKYMIAEGQYGYYDPITLKKILDYLNEFFKNIKRRLQGVKELNISPVPTPTSMKPYPDKEPKRTILCKKCNKRYAVYSASFFCPFCRYSDPLAIYYQAIEDAKTIVDLEEEYSHIDRDILAKHGLGDNSAEKSLILIVTAFETYCKSKYITKIASISSKSKKNVSNQIKNSFQNLTKANKLLSEFNIDIKSIIDTDFSFLQKYFEKRHLFVHNSGIIDQNFIDNTKTDQRSLGRILVFHKSELWMLISELEKIVLEIEDKLK